MRHHRGHDAGRPSRRGLRFVQCARSEGIRGRVCAAQLAFQKENRVVLNGTATGTVPFEFTRWKGRTRHGKPSTPARPAAAPPRRGRFHRDRARLDAGRRRLRGLRPGVRAGRSPAGRRGGPGRCDRVLQRRGLRPARRQVPLQRRNLRLRAEPAGRVARLHCRLGLRDGQDGVVRGDGPHLRALRCTGPRHAPGGRRRRGADRSEPARDHPDRAADQGPAGRGAGHPGFRGGGCASRSACWIGHGRCRRRRGRAAGVCCPRPG